MNRLLYIFVLFFIPQLSFAYCYSAFNATGTHNYKASSSTNASTQVCRTYLDALNVTRKSGTSYGALGGSDAAGGNCYYYGNDSLIRYVQEWARVGTQYDSCPGDPPLTPTCPSGQTWDPTLGLCVNDDPCASLAGQSKGFKVSGNHQNEANPFYNPAGNNFVHPDTVIRNGCSGTVLPGTTVCKVMGNGDYTCTGSAMYDGHSGTPDEQASDSSECSGDECPSTEPTPTTDSSDSCTPWVFGEYGLERQCTSSQANERPGKGSCLTDGSLVCVKASPTPKSEVTATTSDQSKSTNETTGDVTTVTNNTTNKTICQAGACTTTTTTNKTTVVNNAAGDQIGKSGECSGPLCASATNPDADGDGLGDCVKDCGEDEEGEEGSATVSESCEAPPECDGDPFQCAILIQVHYNSCQERRPLNEDEEQSIEAEISAGETANDQAQAELDSSLGGFFSGFQQAASGNSSPGSGQCLPDKSFDFLGTSIALPFSQVCPFLELFRMALIAIAYLIVARTIHTQI